ncbi:QueT transporter family protein [Peptoniphilus sp. KCTC 25270]|uniref:QueT transporter family protein n=1 Tax=Peptoniphilus sp. KCTC 25270 TaxID=2897414 RepID=UPI001E3991C5|nr:QueT transporter family protein [Peptoniphilus sp. KCTC 25270]MCD1146594.1 QueT transporter family protein [Peptoniphilus sp. KCTC 25270]
MKFTARGITRMALIAAVYFALSTLVSSVAYGPIQFRISEILNLLAFYNPVFAPGIVLGVFFTNLGSPLGIYDLFFGTLHTAISLYFMTRTKNKLLASLWPTIFSFIIGMELALVMGGGFKGFITMTLSVMASELIICTLISLPVYSILEKNHKFIDIIAK